MIHYLLDIPGSILKVIAWKCFYGRRFRIPDVHKKFFASGVELNLRRGAQFILGSGKLVVRRGANFSVTGASLTLGEDIFVGRRVSINLHGNCQIGDRCMIGEGVLFFDHDHEINATGAQPMDYIISPIEVGNDVWIGAGSIILKGVKLGDGCVVAAGSLVLKDVAAHSVFRNPREALSFPIL